MEFISYLSLLPFYNFTHYVKHIFSVIVEGFHKSERIMMEIMKYLYIYFNINICIYINIDNNS